MTEYPSIEMAYITCSCGKLVHYSIKDQKAQLVCGSCHAMYQNAGEKGWKFVGPFIVEEQDEETQQMFYSTVLGEYFEDPMWKRCMELATEYHARCDLYDEMVCSDKGYDGAMPRNEKERRLMNLNALDVRKEIYTIADKEGLDKSVLHKAIIHAARNHK